MHAGLQRLHRIELVMDRRCRARQIVNFVHLDIERQRNVTPHDLETRIGQQVLNVLPPAGIKIVDAKNLVAVRKKPFAEMRADESRTSGDERSYSGKAHRKFPILLLMQDIFEGVVLIHVRRRDIKRAAGKAAVGQETWPTRYG